MTLKENESIVFSIQIVKNINSYYLPPITAPANNGQYMQVPLRPLSRGFTVLSFFFAMVKTTSFYLNLLRNGSENKMTGQKPFLQQPPILSSKL